MNQLNIDGVNALHLAVSLGWTEGVRELLSSTTKNNSDISPNKLPEISTESKWPWQELPVLTACRNGAYDIVSLLMESNADLNVSNAQGDLPLHLAAYSHNYNILELLLTNNICINKISAKNRHGNTPLHMLILGHELHENEFTLECCTKLLIQHGAEINAKNNYHRTPLFLAAQANLPKIIETLIEFRADLLITDIDNRSLLHAACSTGNVEALQLLLQSQKILEFCDIFNIDDQNLAPFHLAVYSDSIRCCKLLLENGERLANKDSRGMTRCKFLINNLTSPAEFLEKLFDKQFAFSDKESSEKKFYIKIDFNVLLSQTSDSVNDSIIPDLMCDKRTKLLFNHPLVESFLYHKWRKIKICFIVLAIVYFIFLIAHSYYIVQTYNSDRDWVNLSGTLKAAYWMQVVILTICLMITSVSLIVIDHMTYLKERETYFRALELAFATLVIFSQGTNVFSSEISRILAASSLFFTWAEFLMIFGHIPMIGNNVLVFTRVSGSILIFLFAFSPLFIAFVLCFNVILNEVESFNNYPAVFVRLLVMMTGEIEFSDIFERIKNNDNLIVIVSQIYIFIFVILITILLINVLTALAVGNLPDIELQGKISRLTKEALLINSYERLVAFFAQTRMGILKNLFVRLGGLGSLERSITVWPNQKYKKDGAKLPSRIIEEVKLLRVKKSKNSLEQLQLSFNDFLLSYQKDRENLKNFIQKMEALNFKTNEKNKDKSLPNFLDNS